MRALKNSRTGIILLFIFPVCAFAQSGKKHYRLHNSFSGNESDRLIPSFNLSVNTGILFTEFLWIDNDVYKQKDFNFAYGFSLEKKIVQHFSLRADVSKGILSANNYGSVPSTADYNNSDYRNYHTDIHYMVGAGITFSTPLLTEKEFSDRPVFLNAWAGVGLIRFENYFIQNPEQYIYYGKMYGTYKNVGAGIKYRPFQNVDLGLNYVLHFYDGYNLDAAQVDGSGHKDRFSFTYLSLNFFLLNRL